VIPSSLKIGTLTVNPPVALAPMAGYTDVAFRMLCRKYHCGATLTEVVNAEGTVRSGRQTLDLLEAGPDEHSVGAHIYGANPDTLASAAAIIEKMKRFDFIDINCGCPVPKIVRKGAGAALMRNPEKIEQIVRNVRSAVSFPVTVKTRIGLSPNQINISEVAHAVEAGGGSAIFLHARVASNRHSGPADWETIARIKSERSIPIVGNGGISNAGDVLRMFEQTGVDGVMIGRAAVGNPWLFDEIFSLLNDKPFIPHSIEEHRSVILTHLEHLAAIKRNERRYQKKNKMSADQAAALHFRAHLHQYLKGFPGWPEVRRNLNTMHTLQDIISAVDRVLAGSE